jgi:hypothetical protein
VTRQDAIRQAKREARAASTGRDRKIHYTHARANIRDYTGAALLLPKGCPMNNLALVYLFISICAWFQANGWGLEID